jgi:hypothetical protein
MKRFMTTSLGNYRISVSAITFSHGLVTDLPLTDGSLTDRTVVCCRMIG